MIAFLITAAQWIWNGIQVAYDVTVHVLSVVVGLLWSGLKAAGTLLARFGRASWSLLRHTWDHVLKPAWQKFFKFVDRVHDWLEKHLAPALRKLNALRSRILGWWKRYVRPVLDLIEVTRRVLRVAASLHVPFAHALDVELGEIEERIEKPFRRLVAKVNEVINLVNRVVTLDGLFQRLALVRSLERDMRYAWRAAVNWRSSPIDEADTQASEELLQTRTLDKVRTDVTAVLVNNGGQHAALRAELVTTIGRSLARR